MRISQQVGFADEVMLFGKRLFIFRFARSSAPISRLVSASMKADKARNL
jgi:hypothetical protein